MEDLAARTRGQVQTWARELIDLSRRNTTLYFKPSKRSTLELVAPAVEEIAALLCKPRPLDFFYPPEPAADADGEDEAEEPAAAWTVADSKEHARAEELVSDRTAGSDVRATLRNLARRAEADLLDRGVQSLYVCLGLLHWREAEGEWNRSPLVFVPVALERASAREPYRLRTAGDEAVLNPALRVLMDEQFDIDLPTADLDLEEQDAIETVFDQVRDAIGDYPWRIEAKAVLKRATFHKEAMYQDLFANADAIAQHELVQTLAVPGAGADLAEGAAVPDEDEVDDAAPPEHAHLILDADASQRRAIVAAAGGASIVMDGPPGTGKSQTIANLIAELLAGGKTVLFVSEKSAALDVVANRLAGCGLDDFLLPLHDHRTTRRRAAEELGRALRSHPLANPARRDVDTARAARTRARLTAYAEALNRRREPLGRSVHWVLGRLSQLHEAPRVTPGPVDGDLTPDRLAQLEEGFDRLARRWRPALEADALAWRGVRQDGPAAERLTWLAGELSDALDDVASAGGDLATACGLSRPSTLRSARRVLAVTVHCREQPWTAPGWWQRRDLAALRTRVERLAEVQQRHAAAREPLAQTYADAAASLDAAWATDLTAAVDRLAGLAPALPLHGDEQHPAVDAMRDRADRLVELAAQVDTDGSGIAAALGAPEDERSIKRLAALTEIAQDVDAPGRPEEHWTTPAVARSVEQAMDELEPLQADYAERAQALRDVFDPAVLDLDLRGLVQRFRDTHVGWRKLTSAYRADKREVAAVTRSGRATPQVLERLDDALAWQDSAARLDAAEMRHAAVLGRFAEPRHNRLDEARAALQRVTTAQQRLGEDYNPAGIAAQLAGEQPEDPQLATRAASLQEVLTELASIAKGLLGNAQAVAELSPTQLSSWAANVRDDAGLVADTLAAVDRARHAPATVNDAHAELEQRRQLDNVEAEIAATAEADQTDFEAAYQGLSTDTASLDQALSWVEGLHQHHGGPLPPAAVHALHPDGPPLDPAHLEAALSRADQHRAALVEAFEDDRAGEIDRDLTGSLQQARELARTLADHGEEIEEWRGYRQARDTLEGSGWDQQLTEAAARQIEPAEIGDALRRALWAGWIDAVTAAEHELLTVRADDLDAWVDEFRQLDKAMLNAAAEHVVERCTARRPRSSHGASSIIEREANKKKKHMPIRQLLARTEDVAKALKPCFAMSPLTVSQFLPSEFSFDVVIFDEASQVTPADAVNCVYRGRQLVVTGDDKQLPPTNFFDVASMDDSDEYQEDQYDEFESIITQCKSAAGMPSLPLRWHYRSHHEDLITFSNYQYYAPDNQRLHTFPGARTAGEDLGVHLFEIDGIYRRGGPRDNPIEADRVAERVRVHAGRILAQPSEERETLGVVAFSVAQADAIEHRLDQLRQDHPELEEFFAADRLDGFFVKNLENVQGDERDIMIFSVGYGPDEHGKLSSNLGPLSGPQGHRRLNVAITRARRRVEVLCSFAPSQLDSSKATHRGVPDLKRYLEYARQGLPALGVDLSGSEGDVESPFEESVFDVVRGWGFDVDPQVGTAGYRIDLGVRRPHEPDRYAIGIECDGRAYHSTRVARDRDRLRAEVLRGLGWNLHRIWGPSWYRDRDREIQRLRRAIDEAIGAGPPPHERPARQQLEREVDEIQPLDPVREQPVWAQPYALLRPRDPSHAHPADAGAFRETLGIVRDILQEEAPIHFEVLARRVADTFGRSLTDRVRRATSDAVLTLRRQGRCQRDGDWVRLWAAASQGVVVRVPTEDPRTVRDIEHIPSEELDEAVDRLVSDAQLIAEDELVTAVARLFGVARTSKRIHATLQDAVERLIEGELLERNEQGMVRIRHGRRA